jgi:hypothetical protein
VVFRPERLQPLGDDVAGHDRVDGDPVVRKLDRGGAQNLITASIILKAMFSSETLESISQMTSAVETMITYVDTQIVPGRVPTWVPSRRNHRYFEARDLVHGSIAALIAERRAIHETD